MGFAEYGPLLTDTEEHSTLLCAKPRFPPTSAPQHPITACIEESKRSPEETNKGPPITRPLVFYVNNNV